MPARSSRVCSSEIHGKEKRMTEDFAAAVAASAGRPGGRSSGRRGTVRIALGARPAPFGGWSDHEHGWDEVDPRLDWAARLFVGGRTEQHVTEAACSGDP